MSFNTVKSLIINLGLFQGDNNIRRNIGAYSVNYPSAENQRIQKVEQDLPAGESLTFNPGSTVDTSVTILRVSSRVRVDYTLKSLGSESLVRPSDVEVTAYVNRLLVIDDNVGEFVVTNDSSPAVKSSIFFTQG